MSADETREFERQLGEFAPIDPPDALREKVLAPAQAVAAVSAPRPIHWGWKVAAALLVGGSIAINSSLENLSIGEPNDHPSMEAKSTVGRPNLGERFPYPERFARLPRLPHRRNEQPES